MDWAVFHFWSAALLLAYTLIDARPCVGRQHALGAEVLLGTWLCSWAARHLFETKAPFEAYASIDIGATIVFAVLMLRRRAAWAALCVILHTAMMFLHLAYFVTGQINQGFYLWTLGSLFSASVLTVFIATAAGRHEWGERLDHFFMANLRGWTWSGLIRSRLSHFEGKV